MEYYWKVSTYIRYSPKPRLPKPYRVHISRGELYEQLGIWIHPSSDLLPGDAHMRHCTGSYPQTNCGLLLIWLFQKYIAIPYQDRHFFHWNFCCLQHFIPTWICWHIQFVIRLTRWPLEDWNRSPIGKFKTNISNSWLIYLSINCHWNSLVISHHRPRDSIGWFDTGRLWLWDFN